MADYRTLDGADVAGKRVLLRLDLNVPMKDGAVTDATRIERAAPTVAELAEKGAKVVVVSHYGRPKGKPNAEMSLKPIVEPLSAAVGRPVAFAEDCIGAAAESAVAKLGDGDVVLLENLRFHAGEEANDPAFVAGLVKLADLYVNDAFSAAHRAHGSIDGVARKLPAIAGRLMEAELKALTRALERPERPVAAVVGEAGLGKSRLLSELRRASGLPSLRLRADRYEAQSAYVLARRLLLAVLEDRPENAEALAPRLIDLAGDAAALVPLLGPVLDVDLAETPESAAIDPTFRQARAAAVAAAVLAEQLRRTGPQLVVVEDLHWVDEASRVVLAAIAREAA